MSQAPVQDRVLALAGLAQALVQVRRLAENGQADVRAMDGVLASVFQLDPESTDDVYGTVSTIRPGLLRLREQLRKESRDPQFPKLVMGVLALERSYSRDSDVQRRLRDDIGQLAAHSAGQEPTQPAVLNALADLYVKHISPLSPKVMVQGNPHYLNQTGVVGEIRALLLAALRSAVLWRQLGGSSLDFLLQRKRMTDSVEQLLQRS
ncbi:high frequency lysogenization protein HflD [Solilutibacter silvestris]|uniref:high frequency lysogenization protein HflD n=1 Tax=Solilutibacter silvestris TaxID=1645665 RepID=UPI003D3471B1